MGFKECPWKEGHYMLILIIAFRLSGYIILMNKLKNDPHNRHMDKNKKGNGDEWQY